MASKKDSSGFGSFEDLRRSISGGSDAPADSKKDKQKGWVVETSDEDGFDINDPSLDDLPPLDAAVPARVSGRPPSFGPMEHGPAPYRDTDSDELGILRSFRLRTIFPKDVLEETANLPPDPRPEDIKGRLDLRDELIFTIDGSDAKDYDDAISIDPLPGGGYRLGVHIADVSHYVVEGTALDDEALTRGTSVYLADQVVPMLPEELSNGLCSLVPDRDRLAFTVLMDFDEDGERTASKMAKSVIRSKQRCTYKAVQELLDGKDTEDAKRLAHLEPTLRHFERWTKKQQAIRDQKGSLRINSREKKVVFDDDHEVQAIVLAPRYFSQTLIEETALAANQAVGDHFKDRGLPTIYRVHPEKDLEEVEKVAAMLEKFGIRVPKKDRLTGRDIGRMIRVARKKQNAEALVQRIMGLVERAVYEVRDHEDVATHWGLARKAYLHFTSPIRRYPDLIVHRWLHRISSEDAAEDALKTEALLVDLNDMATHASIQADVAQMAETAVFDLKVCQYMEPRIGDKLEAKVLRVSRGGLEVDLVGHNISGFLPARSIGDRPKCEGSTLTIQLGKRQLSFTEGYAIAIRVKEVDFIKLQVTLELADV
ncbi:MAG: ribonuclease R [Planctomycetota bacterium]|nr:ribonuclease R [Planctomycetota bacterium]